jgi:hypothetical protein
MLKEIISRGDAETRREERKKEKCMTAYDDCTAWQQGESSGEGMQKAETILLS